MDWKVLFLGAAAAESEDLVAVPLRHEARLAAGRGLNRFELRPAHLLNSPALHADEVIMMGAVELHFKAGGPAAARDRRDQAALLEHFKGAKDGGPPDAVRAQGEIYLILAQVAVGLEELGEYQPPRPGQAQSVLGQVRGKQPGDPLGVAPAVVAAALIDDKLPHGDRVSVGPFPAQVRYFRNSQLLK